MTEGRDPNEGAADADPTDPAGPSTVDEPERFEPPANPIDQRTMAILLGAVVLVAVVVLAAVAIARRGDPPAVEATAPAETPTTLLAPRLPGTTTPTTNPAQDLEPVSGPRPGGALTSATTFLVATATGPGDVAVYDSIGASTPTRTFPSSIAVGVEQQARVPTVFLVNAQPANGWLEVYLPTRPNGSTGFVRTGGLKIESHHFHIEVGLSSFRLTAFDGDTKILDAPIAEGTGANPTPGGIYYTTMLIRPPNPNGPYGTYAYGLSGYSDTLKEFNGGDGQLGIHGTNQPELMGQTVSHGCIRLRNEDIDELAGVLPLGVPVFVQP